MSGDDLLPHPSAGWESWLVIGIGGRGDAVRFFKCHLFRSRRRPLHHPLAAVEGLRAQREVAAFVGLRDGVTALRAELAPDGLVADPAVLSVTVPGRARLEGDAAFFRLALRDGDGLCAADVRGACRRRIDWIDVDRIAKYFGVLSRVTGKVVLQGREHALSGLGVVERAWGALVPFDPRRLVRGRWQWDLLSFERDESESADLRGEEGLAVLSLPRVGWRQPRPRVRGSVPGAASARLVLDGLDVIEAEERAAVPRRWVGRLRGADCHFEYEAVASTPAIRAFANGAFVGFDFEAKLETRGGARRLTGSGFTECAARGDAVRPRAWRPTRHHGTATKSEGARRLAATKRHAAFASADAADEDETVTRLRSAQAAVYAADGYARSTRSVALAVTRGLPQALEAASATLTAWGDKLPLIVCNRLQPEEFEAARRPFAAVSATTLEHRSDDAATTTAGLVAAALRNDGPVHVLATEAASLRRLREALDASLWVRATEPHHDPRPDFGEAVALLEASKRPVIVLGSGAAESMEPETVARIAEILGAPVLLTSSASTLPAAVLDGMKRAVDARSVLIPAANLVAVRALATADCVLALGSSLSEVDWFGLLDVRVVRGKVLRVALDEPAVEVADRHIRYDAEHFARDAVVVLQPVADAADRIDRWRRAAGRWKRRIAAVASACGRRDRIEPRFAAHRIVTGAPHDTIFVSEGGACGMWLWSYSWLESLVFPVQQGTIGVTIPMAVGAKLAHPARAVWGILGDGAFYYNARELRTLSELEIPAVFFVFNDSSWSAIRLGQTFLFGGRHIGTDIEPTRYARLAALYGCEAIEARTPDELVGAVDYARRISFTRRGPLVVDVALGKNHVPFAGASFVSAELDGTMRSLVPQSVLQAPRAWLGGAVTPDAIRAIVTVGP